MSKKKSIILGVGLFTLILSGCSSSSPYPASKKVVYSEIEKDIIVERIGFNEIENINVDKNYYKASAIYDTFHSDYSESLKRVEDLGFYRRNDVAGLKHTLPWYYGPNQSLSLADIELLTFSNSSTLYQGFGIGSQLEIIFKNNFDYDHDLDIRAKEVGFYSFSDLYNSVYERFTMSTKNEFIDLLFKLEENGVIESWEESAKFLDSEPLIESFLKPYIHYKLDSDSMYIVIRGNKYHLNKSDFTAYYFTMKICSDILNNAKNRESLYAI